MLSERRNLVEMDPDREKDVAGDRQPAKRLALDPDEGMSGGIAGGALLTTAEIAPSSTLAWSQ